MPGITTDGASATRTCSDSVRSPTTTITLAAPGARPTSVTSPLRADAPTRDGSSEKAAVAPGIVRITTCWYSSVTACARASLAANVSAAISITLIVAKGGHHEVRGSRKHFSLMVVILKGEKCAIAAGAEQRRIIGFEGHALAWHEPLRFDRYPADECSRLVENRHRAAGHHGLGPGIQHPFADHQIVGVALRRNLRRRRLEADVVRQFEGDERAERGRHGNAVLASDDCLSAEDRCNTTDCRSRRNSERDFGYANAGGSNHHLFRREHRCSRDAVGAFAGVDEGAAARLDHHVLRLETKRQLARRVVGETQGVPERLTRLARHHDDRRGQ